MCIGEPVSIEIYSGVCVLFLDANVLFYFLFLFGALTKRTEIVIPVQSNACHFVVSIRSNSTINTIKK